MFFFQFLIQAGLFFTIPLFLSVALWSLSAVETGVRLLPLSITLLLAAVGVPRISAEGITSQSGQLGSGTCSWRESSLWSQHSRWCARG